LIRAYQAPETRAAAWLELCGELTLIRKALPAKVWFRFDNEDQAKGLQEAAQAIDVHLAELLTAFTFTRTEAVLVWLYGKVRDRFRSKSAYWKTASAIAHDELHEDYLEPDASREIEAPEGSSDELEQLWEGTLDPFVFIARHRDGKIQEIEYQILVLLAGGRTSSQVGAALGMSDAAVRMQLRRMRARLFGQK
jgi:hypothetical protein